MHDPLKWWLYDMCAVHHVSTEKGQDIFMLVEKDYPLTKGLATLMLCNKLRVDQQSEMADELLIKIYNIANRPRKISIIEKISDDIEVFLEEEESTELIEEPTKIVEDQGSGEKGEQEVTTADTALNTASVPISTASATPEVSTATANLVYIRKSAEKRKDKSKAITIEDESVQKKSKKQLEQGRLSHEEAIRLQEQIDEEERKWIARDAEIAKQLQEEYDKDGKKEAVAEVDTAHVIDWNDPSIIRYHALQHRPRSVAEGISEEDVQRLKRACQDVEAKPAKRQRIEEVSESVQEQTDEEPKIDELSKEQLNQMVELKMLFEPNAENLLELQKYMHDPSKWWLYDMCAVHHVSTEKGQDIFMLVKKDYPLTKGLATLMLCNKLRVDQQSEMADEFLIKIYNIANRLRK
ncbi:hypothetical protein Tco_0516649 [Tanacetum coccineum]